MWIHLVTFRQALPFSNILEHFCSSESVGDALARLWFEKSCTVGAWRGDGWPSLPQQLWGAPSWAESPFCPQPLEPDVPFAHKFSVYCWLSLNLVTEKCSGRPLLPVVVARVLQAMQEGGTGKEVLPLKQHPNKPHHSQTKVKIAGTFPGTVFLFLRTK